MIKNIFFNVPARRKFLKSNQVEFGFIMSEFERMALVNTDIAFKLVHNDVELYNLPASNFRQRIVSLFGKNLNQHLLSVDVQTSLAESRVVEYEYLLLDISDTPTRPANAMLGNTFLSMVDICGIRIFIRLSSPITNNCCLPARCLTIFCIYK